MQGYGSHPAGQILPRLMKHTCRGDKAGRPVLDLSREASQASMPSQDLDDSSPRTSPAQGRLPAALLGDARVCQPVKPELCAVSWGCRAAASCASWQAVTRAARRPVHGRRGA